MSPAAASLVIHLDGGADRIVDLRQGQVEVGRTAQAAIQIGAPQLSGRHAELSWDGASLWMRDLASTNGTYVNGHRVADWTALHHGDRVRWGPVDAEVVLIRDGADDPPTMVTSTDPPPIPVTPAQAPAGRRPAPRSSNRRVFVSHASEDKRWARYVADALRRQGWDPWLDESDIRGGSSWAASIQAALRSSTVVVLLVTANSVSKEWVLDEVVAARNLRVPIIPAVLEHVRLPDELQFMLQRTQFVDVSGLTASSDQHSRRQVAFQRLDSALLDVLERQGRTNPDRVRMRIGRVLEWLGVLLVVAGFAGFIYFGFRAGTQFGEGGSRVVMAFAVFILGGLLGASGAAMVRAGRAKGL